MPASAPLEPAARPRPQMRTRKTRAGEVRPGVELAGGGRWGRSLCKGPTATGVCGGPRPERGGCRRGGGDRLRLEKRKKARDQAWEVAAGCGVWQRRRDYVSVFEGQ